jgi:hypothetical protein
MADVVDRRHGIHGDPSEVDGGAVLGGATNFRDTTTCVDAVATNVFDVEKEGGLATVGERGSCQRRDSGPSSEKPRARQGHAHARGACIVRGCVACLQLSSLFIAIGFSLQLVASSHDVVWRGAHSGPTTDLAVRAEWTEQCGGSAVFAVTGGRYSWASGHASIGVLFGADGESRAVETELYRRKDADRRREVAGGALNGRDDTAAGRARRLSTKWRAPARTRSVGVSAYGADAGRSARVQ